MVIATTKRWKWCTRCPSIGSATSCFRFSTWTKNWANRSQRAESDYNTGEAVNIVVLQADDRQFGLVVDQICDTQEIVVKPLGDHLREIPIYAGSTIMGDGTVALILDVIGMAKQGSVLIESAAQQLIDGEHLSQERAHARDSFLIVDPCDGSRVAIPLNDVTRIEQINTDQIEVAGHQKAVQYRGEVMPLVSLDGGSSFGTEEGDLSLVVYEQEGRAVGVIIGHVIDIVSDVDCGHQQPQHGENTILDGRVTRIVNLENIAIGA